MRRSGSMAFVAAALLAATACAEQAGRTPVKVFILAGQSNMEGKGALKHLEALAKDPSRKATFGHLKTPDGQWVVRKDVWIDYLGRKGGHSVGYGGESDHIGPELQIGHVLGEHLENQVLLIKCAWGGKSLKVDFLPPSSGGQVGDSYKQTIAHVHTVLDQLKQRFPDYDGRGYEIAGFLWFQGWNDMIDDEATNQYEQNFANLVNDLRKEFSAPEMPFVIAETGNCDNMKFRKAQEAVAKRPEFKGTGRFIPTAGFIRTEPAFDAGYHWNGNAESYFLIGDAMGKAMTELVPTLNAKELTSRTKPIYEMINSMRYVQAYSAIQKMEGDLVRETAGAGSDEETIALEKELIGRLKPMILKRVDSAVAEIQQLDSLGDYYTANVLIQRNAPLFKGIDRYDEQIEPLRKSIAQHPKSAEVQLGAQYFHLLDLIKKSKKRDAQMLLALKQFSVRYPKSAYGKAAAGAFEKLQDPKAPVEPRRYLAGG